MIKKTLKYFPVVILAFIAVWLILPQGISQAASPVANQTTDYVFKNPLSTTTTATGLIYKILAFLLKIAVPITAIMIVWAGFLFVTSAGNENKVKTAQKTLMWAIIGLAVVIFAQSVPGIIKEFLTGNQNNTNINNTNIPNNNSSFRIPNSNVVVTPPPPNLGQALGGMKYKGTICVYDPNADGDDPKCGQPFM